MWELARLFNFAISNRRFSYSKQWYPRKKLQRKPCWQRKTEKKNCSKEREQSTECRQTISCRNKGSWTKSRKLLQSMHGVKVIARFKKGTNWSWFAVSMFHGIMQTERQLLAFRIIERNAIPDFSKGLHLTGMD